MIPLGFGGQVPAQLLAANNVSDAPSACSHELLERLDDLLRAEGLPAEDAG